MLEKPKRFAGVALAIVLGAASSLCGAAAEPVEDFYRGKNISLLIGAAPGGGFDTGGRLMARYLGKYMPGNPNVVPQNMQGAGGLRMANYLANAAAPDGLTIGIHVRGIIQQPMLDDPAAKFDPLKLTWIGTMSSNEDDVYLLVVRRDSGIKSIDDMRQAARPVVLGSVGGVSTNVIFALTAPELFGVNTRLVKGYAGSAGVMLAVQRKEVDGTFIGLSSLAGSQADMLRSGELVPVLQFARRNRHPEFPDVPLGQEMVSKPEDKALLTFIESLFFVALPFSGPPGIPADRTRALREAFMKAHADPEFRAEAERLKVDLSPLDGEQVTQIIADMKATPRSVIERYKRILALAEDAK
jgi:tripartite-type tricarboxylate transporter receptor subunit TctC